MVSSTKPAPIEAHEREGFFTWMVQHPSPGQLWLVFGVMVFDGGLWYCDVADALLQMRPPLPSEALKHFREALRLETNNVHARVGFGKLMNWKFKNVN